MATTMNNTLPLAWDSSISYNLGDTVSSNGIIYKSIVQGNLGHRPASSSEYWEPLDIYKKDLTQMPHGDYSGDENFWNRDNVYIDSNGWIYVNNENTGINVRGRDGTVSFDSLTPEQIETLRGPVGPRGEQGPQGEQGEQGPMGEVVLTPEQIDALRGEEGKSAYDIWLETGHVGTEEDFMNWLTQQSVQIDEALLSDSTNPVANKAIYDAFFAYQVYMNTLMQDYQNRLIALENRLKYEYDGEEHEFKFGVTNSGSYGYIKKDATQVIPFDNTEKDVLQQIEVLTNPMLFSSQFAEQEFTPVAITTEGFDDIVEPSGWSETPSEENDLSSNAIYGTGIQPQSFEDYADAKSYLYKDGRFIGMMISGYALNGMTKNATNISSNGAAAGEGIICVSDLGYFGHVLGLKVAPAVEGTTINYQIGLGTTKSSLPSVISGTNRYSYEEGSFSEETVILYDIINGYKPYFASTSDEEYIITEIYIQ